MNWGEVTIARLERILYAEINGDKQIINIAMEKNDDE